MRWLSKVTSEHLAGSWERNPWAWFCESPAGRILCRRTRSVCEDCTDCYIYMFYWKQIFCALWGDIPDIHLHLLESNYIFWVVSLSWPTHLLAEELKMERIHTSKHIFSIACNTHWFETSGNRDKQVLIWGKPQKVDWILLRNVKHSFTYDWIQVIGS